MPITLQKLNTFRNFITHFFDCGHPVLNSQTGRTDQMLPKSPPVPELGRIILRFLFDSKKFKKDEQIKKRITISLTI
jgi:hypothetical protein